MAMVGGMLGGIFAIAAISGGFFVYKRRKKIRAWWIARRTNPDDELYDVEELEDKNRDMHLDDLIRRNNPFFGGATEAEEEDGLKFKKAVAKAAGVATAAGGYSFFGGQRKSKKQLAKERVQKLQERYLLLNEFDSVGGFEEGGQEGGGGGGDQDVFGANDMRSVERDRLFDRSQPSLRLSDITLGRADEWRRRKEAGGAGGGPAARQREMSPRSRRGRDQTKTPKHAPPPPPPPDRRPDNGDGDGDHDRRRRFASSTPPPPPPPPPPVGGGGGEGGGGYGTPPAGVRRPTPTRTLAQLGGDRGEEGEEDHVDVFGMETMARSSVMSGNSTTRAMAHAQGRQPMAGGTIKRGALVDLQDLHEPTAEDDLVPLEQDEPDELGRDKKVHFR